MRSQAALQLVEPTPEQPLAYEVHDPAALRRLPEPSDGDVFFDFEGDPMWRDGPDGDAGLEYLFGCLTVDGGGNSGYNENKEWRRSYVYQESGRRNFAQRL